MKFATIAVAAAMTMIAMPAHADTGAQFSALDLGLSQASVSFGDAGQSAVAAGGLQSEFYDSFAATGPIVAKENLPIILVPQDVEAVPEPATWAMMIIGFGLVGASLRRRRAEAPSAA